MLRESPCNRHTLDSMRTQLYSSQAGKGAGKQTQALVSLFFSVGSSERGPQKPRSFIVKGRTHPRKEPTGVRATEAMYTGGKEDMLNGG